MTPKEKAEDLFTKFVFKGAETKQIAIESALIVVDEILDLFLEESRHTRYWKDVIKEIKNLKTK
jgi:hypothetical protein